MGPLDTLFSAFGTLDWQTFGPPALLILVVLLLVQSVRLWLQRGRAARRVARHRELGQGAEKVARQLLLRSGYKIVAEQATSAYEILVDGLPVKIHLRSDFVVKKGKQSFVAEAKGGEISAKVTGRATRRQLLEYLLAFDVDGVLLVDVQGRRVTQIEFPLPQSRRHSA